ncbi:MAG: hypothetical protein MUO26_12660 [Methanotrichaceae archaeon]|nr:hypothetical protein [Methanotrichaceae archaeon]
MVEEDRHSINIDAPRGYEAVKAVQKKVKKIYPKFRKIESLLVMSNGRDPFYCGSPADIEKAEWFKELWDKYNFTKDPHLRAIHYRHVSQVNPTKHDGTPYRNIDSDAEYLIEAAKRARLLGYVDPDKIIDQRNPDPKIYRHLPGMFTEVAGNPHTSYDSSSEWTINGFGNAEITPFEAYIPPINVGGYSYNTYLQPYHIEVWCEKTTMDDVIDPICQKYHANYVPGMGFTSIPQIRNLLRRIQQLDKPTVLFYISDFDPAGSAMPVQVARYIEYWLQEVVPDADIKLTPLVLTKEQVERYDLPTMPMKTKKYEDTEHLTRFELLHGNRVVELDALEALHPGELAKILEEAILPYRDLNLAGKLSDTQQQAQQVADAAWEDRTEPIQKDLVELENVVNPILESYADRFKELQAELDSELRPHNEKLESLRHAVEKMADSLKAEIGLPEVPDAQVDPPDRDWLYDSGRGWLDQLEAYKRTHSGEVNGE